MTLAQSGACSVSQWTNGAWMDCTFGPLTDQLTVPLFALLTVGAIIGAMYLADPERSMAGPSVALILIAGFALPILPAGYRGVAWTIMFLGVVAAVLSVSKEWVLG